MRATRRLLAILVLGVAAPGALAAQAGGDDVVTRWQDGLEGVRLTAYSGSAISSNSTLTVLDLCTDGRYRYSQEGSWSVPGQAGGASTNQVTGRWEVGRVNGAVVLLYRSDQGEEGAFPVYLQNDGRVNVGGAAYSAEQGAARC